MSRAAAKTCLVGPLPLLLQLSASTVYSQPMHKVTCEAVQSKLIPCVEYLSGTAAEPSKGCCDGVKDADKSLKNQDDRTAVCQCIKNAMSNNQYDPARVAEIPKKCGLPMDFPPIKPDAY